MLRNFIFVSFFLTIVGVYVLTLRGVVGNPTPIEIKNNLDQTTKPLELSPERGRYALVMSLAENKSFALTQILADAVYPDVGYHDNKFYIFFAPGISVMALPLYFLGKHFQLAQVATFSLSIIFALLNYLFLYKISTRILKLPFWVGILSGLIFSFASASWPYAVTLYQHQATTFFLLSGFYGAWIFKQNKKFSFLGATWAWLAYALAISIDYPNVLFYFPIMLYLLYGSIAWEKISHIFKISFRPSIIFASFLFLLVSFVHGYYNHIHFGSWKSLSSSITGYTAVKELNLLDSKNKEADLDQIVKSKDPVRFFTEVRFPWGLKVLTISKERGLFYFFPIFILIFPALIYFIRDNNAEKVTLVSIPALILFLYSSWGDPWGGWAFGPRYLIPALSICSLIIASWVNRNSWFWLRKLFVIILFAFSCAVSLLGTLTTNAVPPESEAKLLKIGYNYWYNIKFLQDNHGSSFIYNNFFKLMTSLSLIEYFMIIYCAVMAMLLITLFVLPSTRRYDH